MLKDLEKHKRSPREAIERRQQVKNRFWDNIKTQYLIALRTAKYKAYNKNRKHVSKIPKEGAVVMIHDLDMRAKWRMGIIIRLLISPDGETREAIVRTTVPSKSLDRNKCMATRLVKKAIVHLHPLELEVEDYYKMNGEVQYQDIARMSSEMVDAPQVDNLEGLIEQLKRTVTLCKYILALLLYLLCFVTF